MTLPTRIQLICAVLLALGYFSPAFGQDVPFFQEDFDGVTPPVLPFGWLDSLEEWSTSSSVASSGSGGNNLTIAGSQAAALHTPSLNLSGLTSGSIEYLARRTSTYPQDSLIVFASTDGGGSFPITLLDRGESLPSADGSYELISMAVPASLLGEGDVVLQFVALGGTTSGSNIRIDDVMITGEGDPTAGNSVFGFSTSASTLDPSTGIAEVPVFLDFENVESLQGLQLQAGWDVSELIVASLVPGPAVSSSADWSLSFNTDGNQLTAVLLGNEGVSLGTGLYDPLFTIQFSLSGSSASLEANLSVDAVIGALAVSTGDDAGLLLGQDSHTITLDPGDAVFSPDATELDAGQVSVGNIAEVFLTVSNTGNTDLVISDVTSSNELFSLFPTAATVSPGSSQAFTIAFTPSFLEFGFQTTTLTFAHNADGGSTPIQVTGIGTGGRGDASQDGLVDVLDLVLGIDYVLGVVLPDPTQAISTDLFPFELPDGSLDVRDLTVLSQGILAGSWPDGLPLPTTPPALAATGKVDLHVQPLVSETESTLFLSTDAPFRAIQLSIKMDVPLAEPIIPVDMDPGLTTQWLYDAWAGELRVLAVRMDGGSLDPGNYPLVTFPGVPKSYSMQLTSGTAILEGPQRVPLTWLDAADTQVEETKEVSVDLVGIPYPNPFEVGHGRVLHIPLTLFEQQVVQGEVFDLLGRQVYQMESRALERGEHMLTWNGLDTYDQQVAAGLYLVRLTTNDRSLTRLVTVY